MNMRKNIRFAVLLLALILLCGCGSSKETAPEEISIEVDGETVATLSVANGTEAPTLTAKISPEDYSGELQWSSDDGGVVRITTTEGNSCTISVLKSGTAKITAACGGKSATVKVTVTKNLECLSERETAYFINDNRYSAEQMNLYFVDAYQSFVETYGDYAEYYGLDLESGLSGLSTQYCDYSSDGTWRGYFLECACSNLLYRTALCDWAEENGISLSRSSEETIQQGMEELTQAAEEAGYDSLDTFLEATFGTGITASIYEEFLRRTALAGDAYTYYTEALTYSEEELLEHYSEMGYEDEDNDYPMVTMRHILIFAEEGEDGSYTEDAIAAAHEKILEIYETWTSGEQTEESFAELAEQYSEDTGSIGNGGMYENIYKQQMIDEINDWLFTESRQIGDTTVIDYNGSYVGSHLVLYCGTGENYSHYLSRTDLMDTAISEWEDMLLEAYTPKEGADYTSVGVY